LFKYGGILAADNSGFARVPFSLAAITILLISTLMAGHVYEITQLKAETDLEHRQQQINHAFKKASEQFEITVYTSLQNVISSIGSLTELEVLSLNEMLEAECALRLEELYPSETEEYAIFIEGFSVLVVEDWAVEKPKQLPNVNSEENKVVSIYLRLIGSISLGISFRHTEGLTARHSSEFVKHVQVPLPMVLNKASSFKAQGTGGYSNLARLTRYILTTAVQLRVLSGQGIDASLLNELLTRKDVESAVNLAILLEQARIFRAYDPLVANGLGLEEQFKKYMSTGQLDGSDLYFTLKGMQNDRINLGRLIAASIESFADEFVYRLLTTFWQDETADPVMQEPNLNWSALQAAGEDYAREKLEEWLNCFKRWLILPPVLLTHIGSATIPTIKHHAISVDEVSRFPVPLPVRGYYELFSMPYPAKWFVFTGGLHTDPDNWPPVELTLDPIDLILGESKDSKFRPKPYEISFMSTFGIPKTVKYYPVHKSFISLFAEPGSKTPYFDCLKHLLETLRSGITVRTADGGSKVPDEDRGMLDLMAEDAELLINTVHANKHWSDVIEGHARPDDGAALLEKAPGALLNGPVSKALNTFRNLARSEELSSLIPGSGSWYENGMLKKNRSTKGGLYDIFIDTVDLFYELYSTLKKSSEGKVGKLDGNWAWNFPMIYFAPLDGVQEKRNKNDSFNFKRDAVKHAYNNVWTVVTLHFTPNRLFFKPDTISPGKLELASPPIPIVAWETYGWDKYPWDLSGPNLHLWDDVHNALKDALISAFDPKRGVRLEVDLGLKIMDKLTDERKYDKAFHEFLWLYIGREIFNPAGARPEGMLESLVRSDEGLIQNLLIEKLPEGISKFINTYNLIETTELSLDEPFSFKKNYSKGTVPENYEFTEEFVLEQFPPDLKVGSTLSITISEPRLEPRFVSVQEHTSDLSDSPFITSWTASVKGDFNLVISTREKCLMGSE
jgi:hypothetical protein